MALVSYSDSENSDDEPQTKILTPKPDTKTIADLPKPIIDKSQPNRIKVNLSQQLNSSTHDEEPPTKRPRVGPGAFAGFNSMLPAPKRDNVQTIQNNPKPSARKVFSLKTGAEAAFSRESDAELRELFSEQQEPAHETADESDIQPALHASTFAKPAPPSTSGSFIFKPLSVARNQKKKKPTNSTITNLESTSQPVTLAKPLPTPEQTKKKISLFSTTIEDGPSIPEPLEEEELQETEYMEPDEEPIVHQTDPAITESGTESLDAIATDLNLSKAERRQLFGRTSSHQIMARNIINFNTDEEYAANQELISQGETVQHNPVRGIAPGKHSLRQLVNAASGQKEALEESFAQGKRNKKEAGNKYGW